MNRQAMIEELMLLDELKRRKPAWKPMREDPRRPGVMLPQGMAFDCKASIIGFGGSGGGGKGLALFTAIPTVTGWTTMGELKVGDSIFDQDGKPCKVTYVSPVSNRPCYRLTFDDGSTIVADDVHRWTVTVQAETKVVDTEWLFEWDRYLGCIIWTYFRTFSIVKIEPCESVPTKCITVDSPSHQFLAGRQMVATHNTSTIVGKALTQAKNAIIYRKHFADFEGIEREFNKTLGANYIKRGSQYMVAPPTGQQKITAQRILFGSLDNEVKDRDKYQGRDYDLIAFDEVTQMSRDTVEYLMQWNRSADPDQLCQVIMTFNPPTRPEGLWVKDYFAPWLNKAHHLYGKVESGQVLHRVAIPTADGHSSTFHYFDEAQTVTHNPVTGEELKRPLPTRSITFIRSRLSDNLYLRDTNYEATLLGSSDPAMARIMLDGDFDTDFKDGILSVFKPHIWAESVARYKALEQMPTGAPDVVAIDAAKGGEDEMVIQLGWRIVEQGKPTKYIYPPSIRVRGALVNTSTLQWEFIKANVPHLLDSRLIVVDIVGGAGESIADMLENEVMHRHGRNAHVIRFVGGRNSNWRSIHDWETGEPKPGAMGYANDVTSAWHTASAAQQHTHTCVHPDEELQRQCLSRNFANTDGNYQLESKERFSQRLGRSPDHADAYCMAAQGLHRYLDYFGL